MANTTKLLCKLALPRRLRALPVCVSSFDEHSRRARAPAMLRRDNKYAHKLPEACDVDAFTLFAL